MTVTEEELKRLGFERKHDTISVRELKKEGSENQNAGRIHSGKEKRNSGKERPGMWDGNDDNELVERRTTHIGFDKDVIIRFDKYLFLKEKQYAFSFSFNFPKNRKHLYPVLVTDTLGREYGRLYSKTKLDFNTLLPIKIDVGDKASEQKDEVIFWYEPNADFLNVLQKDLGNSIKQEYEAIVKDIPSEKIHAPISKSAKPPSM
ncbi:MAG: hypothetical protein HC906_19545 [Bacteroidales bacterium]|nr:hypothetical protein [Bacteroidales bacterium]